MGGRRSVGVYFAVYIAALAYALFATAVSWHLVGVREITLASVYFELSLAFMASMVLVAIILDYEERGRIGDGVVSLMILIALLIAVASIPLIYSVKDVLGPILAALAASIKNAIIAVLKQPITYIIVAITLTLFAVVSKDRAIAAFMSFLVFFALLILVLII